MNLETANGHIKKYSQQKKSMEVVAEKFFSETSLPRLAHGICYTDSSFPIIAAAEFVIHDWVTRA